MDSLRIQMDCCGQQMPADMKQILKHRACKVSVTAPMLRYVKVAIYINKNFFFRFSRVIDNEFLITKFSLAHSQVDWWRNIVLMYNQILKTNINRNIWKSARRIYVPRLGRKEQKKTADPCY